MSRNSVGAGAAPGMLANIQALRAVAALFVVFAHLVMFDRPLLERPLSFGIYGVDLFFVISGLVMVRTTADKRITPVRFFANRIARIVPLYWAATLLVFGTVLALPDLLGNTRADAPALLKSLFFVPFEKAPGVLQPVLFLGWTLNYEMAFYAVFAAGLLIRGTAARVWAVSAVFLAIVVAGAIAGPASPVARFYSDPIILEFVFGMGIGTIAIGPRCDRWTTGLSLLAVTGGLLWIIVYPAIVVIPPYRAATIGLPAAVVVLGALRLEAAGWRVASPMVLLIGSASYVLYLSHTFVLIALDKLLRAGGLPDGALLPLIMAAATAVALAVAVAIHLGFERPVDRFLRRLGGRSRSVVQPVA